MSYQNIRQFVPRNDFPILSLEIFDMSLTSDEIDYFMNIFHNGDVKYYGDEYYKFYFVDLMGL